MELKGTKTEKNLQDAFAGESQARNKYTYFAEVARENGMNQIADIFLETARNEQEHAKLWFQGLHGGKLPELAECLTMAAEGEHYEWETMYSDMAKVASEEGFNKIATQMNFVSKVEKLHEERFLDLLKQVEESSVYKKEEDTSWTCSICGYTMVGKKAPNKCPLCGYSQSYFEKTAINH
jgi:rubrerythrin